jgi:signal transduction histidine kinase
MNEKMKSKLNVCEPVLSITTARKDNKVMITIKDNGIGIPQKNMDKIFHPFFTTKPPGEGTGLGLSLSYDMIKAHQAELKVDSTEGEYAAFTIILNNE